MKKLVKFTTTVALFIGLSANVFAQNVNDALSTLKSATETALSDLSANKSLYKNDPSALSGLVKNKMIPYFDADIMARFVLGQNWNSATETQKADFIKEFQELVIRSYSAGLIDYADASVTYGTPSAMKESNGANGSKIYRTEIDVTVTNADNTRYPMVISMVYNNGQWRIWNATVDNFSVLMSYRGSLGEDVANRGLQAVIDEFKVLNANAEVIKK